MFLLHQFTIKSLVLLHRPGHQGRVILDPSHYSSAEGVDLHPVFPSAILKKQWLNYISDIWSDAAHGLNTLILLVLWVLCPSGEIIYASSYNYSFCPPPPPPDTLPTPHTHTTNRYQIIYIYIDASRAI